MFLYKKEKMEGVTESIDNSRIFKTSFCKVGQPLWLIFFFYLSGFYFDTLIVYSYEQA